MEIFLMYLKVFAVGGALCALGQLLINKTKMSSARILVCFMLLGALLETTGAFGYMKEYAGAGDTVPITGFGSTLVKGALEGAKESGLIGAVRGPGTRPPHFGASRRSERRQSGRRPVRWRSGFSSAVLLSGFLSVL